MRFGFAIIDGPGEGLCLGGWRVHVAKNDVFISAKSMKSMKVTLHDETRSAAARPWRFAYTSEHMDGPNPVWPRDRDRALHKFEPTPFDTGVRKAFAIAVPRGGLRYEDRSPKEHTIAVPDRWDVMNVACILMTEPGIEPGGLNR